MKNKARRFWCGMFLLVLLCACLSAGAKGKKINLIFIGGDADVEDGPNNTFRNLLLHHEDLQENAEHFFIKSTMRDYTNKTAQIHTGEAEAYLSPEAVNVVCGYSHGGQSVFFMNMDLVRDIWLFDACVSIGGKCSNPTSNGKVWAELSTLHGLGILDVHTAELQKFNGEDNHTYIIDDIGVVDGVYYDLSGEKIADVQLYKKDVLRRGKFSEAGYAPLVLQGDGSYMTFVDKSGNEQFEPILLGDESSFYDDHFATVDPNKSTEVVIYDHTGKEKYRVTGVKDDKDLRLYDDYFIAGKNYYFFK